MFSDDVPTELYRQLVDGVPDAVVVADANGIIVLVTRQAETMFGYTRAELLGQTIERLVPDRFADRHVHHRSTFAHEPSVRVMGSGLQLMARHRDGWDLPVEISLGPIETPQGRLTAAIIRDVSDRRRLEEDSRRKSFYLQSAVESIGEAFTLVDEHDQVVLVNSAARELFHVALAGPADARTFGDIVEESLAAGTFDTSQESREQLKRRWLDYHQAPSGALDIATADGQALRVSERRTAEGGAVMLVADVSADRARADELRRAREQADAANAAKSEFLASMSHELRTPLNAVLGFTQLLQRDRKNPLTERQQERLAHVMRGGEHLLKLIDEVLDLARIEAGRVSISPEPVDIGDVLVEVRSSLEPLASRAGITLVAEPLATDVRPVRADRTRLAQILMNFGSNAIKYGRTRGHVTFSVQRMDDALRVTVRDDGIGIPVAHRARIFEPFQRAGQETGPIEGTGIGLTISKRLAQLMDGDVGFDSEEGRGSAFWVDVPLHSVGALARAKASGGTLAESLLSDTGTRKLVIYVEDNPSNIAFMCDALEELPAIELLTAPSAEIGLDLIRARLPAVVIMDLNLPGMSGIEATRRLAIWPETRDIPVVALTAAAMARDTARAAGAGFYRYLTKPVRLDELAQVLDELLSPR